MSSDPKGPSPTPKTSDETPRYMLEIVDSTTGFAHRIADPHPCEYACKGFWVELPENALELLKEEAADER